MPTDIRYEQSTWIQSLLDIQTISDGFRFRDDFSKEETETLASITFATDSIQEVIFIKSMGSYSSSEEISSSFHE